MVSDCAWYSCFTDNSNLIEKQFYKRLSAARRQKKKSRRTADIFSCHQHGGTGGIAVFSFAQNIGSLSKKALSFYVIIMDKYPKLKTT